MYALFKRRQERGKDVRFQFVAETNLFGRNKGWIPDLAEKAIEKASPKRREEPYRWHVALREALLDEKVREWMTKEYRKEADAIIIGVKPRDKKLFLCELMDVWGFSADGWTPMLWRLRVLKPKRTKCRPDDFADFSAVESGVHVYEFLYATGTFKKGKIEDTWLAPKSSPTNGALLWPDRLTYFLRCIEETERG